MSAVSNNYHSPDLPLENATFLKAITCIPLLGALFSFFPEMTLAQEINNTETSDTSRLIKLINIKNQYKAAAVVSYLLATALVVTAIALHILPIVGPVIGISIWLGLAGLEIFKIYHNKKVLNELQSTGLISKSVY